MGYMEVKIKRSDEVFEALFRWYFFSISMLDMKVIMKNRPEIGKDLETIQNAIGGKNG